MISRATRVAFSAGLTLFLGFAFTPVGCGGSEKAAHPPVRLTRGNPEAPPRVVEQLTECANQTTAPFPPAEGNRYAIDIDVYVTQGGRVSSVEVKDSTLGGHQLESCIAGVLEEATFPVHAMTMELSDPVAGGPVAPPSRAQVAFAPALPLAPVALAPVILPGIGFIIVVAVILYVRSESSTTTVAPPIATAAPTTTTVPTAVPTVIPKPRKYPNQTCEDEEREALGKEKDRICEIGYAAACSGNPLEKKSLMRTQCSKILLSLQQRKACLAARWLVQDKCFGGKPDERHWPPIKETQKGIDNCEALKLVNCAKGHPMAGL